MTVQTEAERQFYLEVAGISCWYSRTPLTGAAPSPDFDFGESAQPVPGVVDKPVADRKQLGQARRQSLAAIQGLVSTSPTDVSTVGASESQSAVVSEGSNAAPAAEIASAPDRLVEVALTDTDGGSGDTAVTVTRAYWGLWFSDRFVLVSALSADASTRLQDALAENILRALGQTSTERHSLQWPVFSNPGVPGNDEAGLKAVLRELAAQIGRRKVITLGLLSEHADETRSAWLETVLGCPLVDFPFSLAALSADPDRKRQLWLKLRPVLGPPV